MSQSSRGVFREFIDEIDPAVFTFGAGVTLLFVVLFAWSPETAYKAVQEINNFLWTTFAWAYLGIMLLLVGFVFFLLFSSWGTIKFGGEDVEPEYSYLSYFTMFFSAGLAAGIVFWGPAESIFHFQAVPPLFTEGIEPKTREAMVPALTYTLFHWGLTAWAPYLIIGIPIAYYAYNYDAPFRVSTVIAPFIGVDNIENSLWATLVDILAVFATLGGVATSLGFIGSQLLAGIQYQWGYNFGDLGTIAIITGVTVIFTATLVLGVSRGIRWLSNLNVALFVVLAIGTFVLGNPWFVLNLGVQALGKYMNDFLAMSLYAGVASNSGFIGSWTIFYWAWWFAWAPFAGLFLARISRGRTVRETVFTGLIATTLATVPWFIIVGGTSMWMQNAGVANIIGVINTFGTEAVAGYPIFAGLPLGTLWVLLFIALVITFFTTSADSSTLAISMITTGGKEHPTSINRIFWAVLQGVVASILMVIGGVEALQAAAIVTDGPFAIVCLIAMYGMIKEFSDAKGRILLQEDTVIWGSPNESSSTDRTSAVSAENDD
jgi:glycine betaine transporter